MVKQMLYSLIQKWSGIGDFCVFFFLFKEEGVIFLILLHTTENTVTHPQWHTHMCIHTYIHGENTQICFWSSCVPSSPIEYLVVTTNFKARQKKHVCFLNRAPPPSSTPWVLHSSPCIKGNVMNQNALKMFFEGYWWGWVYFWGYKIEYSLNF